MLNRKKVDWFITLIPMFIIVGISFLFFIFPEQSNDILGQVTVFLWGYIWYILYCNRS